MLARAYHVAHLGAIALLPAGIYAKLPAAPPTLGELRAATAAKRGPKPADVLDRVPLVRVQSGEVTVDRVDAPVEVEGPVDVTMADEPVAVRIQR